LVWDSTGDKLLNGTYYFRQVIWSVAGGDEYALYGTVTFSGSGTYTMSATELDAGAGSAGSGTVSGTYAIGAGGFGYLSSPLSTGVQVRGMVSNGVFIGSSTESGYNDLFIAALIPTATPTLSSFNGSYAMSYINFPSPVNGDLYDASFTLTPNGAGTIGTVNATGYYLGQGAAVTSATTQSASGVKYTASNGAVVITFPTFNTKSPQNTALLSGQEYLYFSPDGNFVFGGSPGQADMFVGVKTGSSPTLGASLYYDAGVFGEATAGDLDSYYGSLTVNGGGVVEHSRIYSYGYGNSFDSVTTGTAPTTPGATYSDPFYNYTIGSGGLYRIGFGLAETPGIDVALAAPTFTGTGVYLNPTGVVNAASYAPFTAGLSPGELLVLTGTGLASNASIGAADIATTSQFPVTLNGVQVYIDGIAAPLYYVSSTQIAAIVPFAASQYSFATIQVKNNGVNSNIITEFMNPAEPGVFTNPADGVGIAAADRYDANGNFKGIVSEKNPAEPGDTIALFVTGLGQVFPPSTDGAPGSSSSLNYLINYPNSLTVEINDSAGNSTSAAVNYAGLAPGLTGLYQINFTVPSGVASGDTYLEVDFLNTAGSPTAVSEEAILPVGSGATASVPTVGTEIQNGQTYKSSKHRETKPLQRHIIVKTPLP
jgi:uncharacterized protein (TIGR03437 family)